MEKLKWWLISLGIFIVMNIPAGVFLLVKHCLAPEGFWQKFVVYGLGVYFLGGVQIVFWIIGVVAIYFCLTNKKRW